jgi:hypothetical protein
MADEKTAEKDTKAEKKETKFKLPEGYITPVEATHKLKKEVNPATGQPYAEAKLSSQQMYTLTRTAETNKMPVLHFTEDGKHHKERQVDAEGNVISRPGFKWEDVAEWYANRPTRAAKAAAKEDKSDDDSSEASDDEASDDSDELEDDDELEEDDEDDDDEEGALVEAE